MNKVKKINNMRTWSNRVIFKVSANQDLIQNPSINQLNLHNIKLNLFSPRTTQESRTCLLASSRHMMLPLSTSTHPSPWMTTTQTSSLTMEALLLHNLSSIIAKNRNISHSQQKRISKKKINIQPHRRILINLQACHPPPCRSVKALSLGLQLLLLRSSTPSSFRASTLTTQ